jgi:hypothetical protein
MPSRQDRPTDRTVPRAEPAPDASGALDRRAEAVPGRYRLRVLGDGAAEVTTMGGLQLGTDGALRDVDPSAVASLVLPGAHTWAEGHREC